MPTWSKQMNVLECELHNDINTEWEDTLKRK